MKDNFKKYVNENRADFENYEADFDAIWESVDAHLESPKKGNLLSIIWKVAAAVVILVLSVAVFYLSNRSPLPNEVLEAEAYYGELIKGKMNRLRVYEAKLGSEVFADFDVIDSAYQDLKNDLKDGADNEEVVGAMIQTYRLKLEMLERILEEIEQEENEIDQNEISI